MEKEHNDIEDPLVIDSHIPVYRSEKKSMNEHNDKDQTVKKEDVLC